MTHSLTVIARRLSFIRETEGANKGAWVEWVQRLAGGRPGDSWCSQFSSLVCDIAYHGKPPIRPHGASHKRMEEARQKGFVVTSPEVDDLYFFVNSSGHAHHEGIITAVRDSGVDGIAGNTSEDGLSSNGTGVFEHALHVLPKNIVYVRLPK